MANTNLFCQAALLQMNDENFPLNFSSKVTETGFLNMLLSQPVQPNIQQFYDSGTGHNRGSVLISYQPRSVVEQVQDNMDCDVDIVQAARRTTFTPSLVSKLSLYIDHADMIRYCEDASRTVMQGMPATPFMNEFLSMIYSSLNGPYQHVDKQLATSMSTKWGANAANSYSTAAKTITIPLANTQQDLDAGVTQMLGDLQDNEFCGQRPLIVSGSNLFRNYVAQKTKGGIIHNQAGVNDSASLDFDFFYDKKLRTLWNTEEIGVFDPGAVAMVSTNYNVGNFAGQVGADYFGVFFDKRVQCATGMATYQDFAWDLQIRPITCPTTLTNGYTGQSGTYGRGWQFIFSKHYDLWVPPTDMFDGGDVTRGQNGTLRFTIANA